ncbi:Hydroxyacid oxidase 1, partial [Fragariocoptes setiger]
MATQKTITTNGTPGETIEVAMETDSGSDLALISDETLDRASPEIWPELFPGLSNFLARACPPIKVDQTPDWLREFDQNDMAMLNQFGSLTPNALVDELKLVQNVSYQFCVTDCTSNVHIKQKFWQMEISGVPSSEPIQDTSQEQTRTPTKNYDDDLFQLISVDELVELHSKLEKGETLELDWKCPGRRPPSDVKDGLCKNENPMHDQNNQNDQNKTEQDLTHEFDFDEDNSISSLTPSLSTSLSSSRRRSMTQEKRPTSLHDIMNDMLKYKVTDNTEQNEVEMTESSQTEEKSIDDVTRNLMHQLIGLDCLSQMAGLSLLVALLTHDGRWFLDLLQPGYNSALFLSEPIFSLLEIVILMELVTSFGRWLSHKANEVSDDSESSITWTDLNEDNYTRSARIYRVLIIMLSIACYIITFFIFKQTYTLLPANGPPVMFTHALIGFTTFHTLAIVVTLFKDNGIITNPAFTAIVASGPIYLAAWFYHDRHILEEQKRSSSWMTEQKKMICVDDYERQAFRSLPKEALDYYRSGADEETTLRANCEAYKRFKILPRFLRDVSHLDIGTQLFGQRLLIPIGVSPTAMHKLAHRDGELATVRAAAKVGTVMTLSTLATHSIEQVADAGGPQCVKWFQLYVFKERQVSLELVQRAERAGFKAIVLTVDAPKFGTRRRDIRNNFQVAAGFLSNFAQVTDAGLQQLDYLDESLTWADVHWLVDNTTLPVLVKGIMTPEDALLASEHGARGVIVSNHGGRQLDGVPSTIEVLPQIAAAVGQRLPVLLDGGIRCGSDVFKALALGAQMVFVGRPILWGLACEGQQGVESVLKILEAELRLTMMLSGCATLPDIQRDMVVHES